MQYLLQGKLLPIAKKYKELMIGDAIDLALAEEYLGKLCAESMKAYIQTLMPVFKTGHIRKTPILVMGGDKDQIFSMRDFEETARKYEAPLEVISGAGHNLMLEPNHEEIAAKIEHWFTRESL